MITLKTLDLDNAERALVVAALDKAGRLLDGRTHDAFPGGAR